jgi:hypothetical protein
LEFCVETIAAFFISQAKVWCPLPDDKWPPTELQQCTGIIKVAHTLKEGFQLVIDITVTVVTSFVDSFKEMRNTMCDKSAGSKLNCVQAPAGSQSILKEQHATGNASTDGWIQFVRVIALMFSFLIKVFMEVIMPIVLCFVAFMLDILILIIQLFKFLVVQGAGVLSRLVGFALKNLANMNIDSQEYVPEQDALAFIDKPPVMFLENAPGPPFIKKLLLTALTIIKESVRAAFYAVVGFLLLVDKTFCMIFYPFECIIKAMLDRAAQICRDAEFAGHRIVADGFSKISSIFKACKCSYCPVQSDMPVYFVMKKSPCNPLMPDPNSGDELKPCCTDSPVGFWLFRLVMGLYS